MQCVGISSRLIACSKFQRVQFPQASSKPRLIHHRRYPTSRKWSLFSSEVDPTTTTDPTTPPDPTTPTPDLDPSFIFAFDYEQLPKGVRKETLIDGKQIVVFWYRNEIFACEGRSPAEGAFSTGFLDASFTPNYGIICPGTGTVFSLKTGEILEWYPNNFVLKTLIPKDTCRPLEVYPVKTTEDGIYVSFKGGSQGGVGAMKSKGGANTSLEDNNVFGLEPKMYSDEVQGANVGKSASKLSDLNPATLLIATIAIGIVSVAGTAAAIYFESIPGLIAFWVVLFGIVAFVVSRVLGSFEKE